MRTDMLGPDCDRLWIAYLAAERDGIKTEREAALAAFIALATRQPEERQSAFARAWCAANLDGARWAGHLRGAPVRLPLLREIVGPALLRGRAEGDPGCARWLAHLWDLLNRGDWTARLAGIGGPAALLDEALALDPGDELARAERVRDLIGWVCYALHELPMILDDQEELRSDLELLAALGPVRGQHPPAFDAYVAAARTVLDGARTDDAIDAYFDAERRLKEGA